MLNTIVYSMLYFTVLMHIHCLLPLNTYDCDADVDLFGATPFSVVTAPTVAPQKQAADDPFGMTAFSPAQQDLDRQIANNDREMLELQASQYTQSMYK